jgi:hypothetical protein
LLLRIRAQEDLQRQTAPITKAEASGAGVDVHAGLLLRLDAATMEKPLDHHPVGDDAEVGSVGAITLI